MKRFVTTAAIAAVWLTYGLTNGLCGARSKSPTPHSSPQADDRKLVVAVMNQITWHDLLSPQVQAPTLRKLAKQGAVGLMCVRTARAREGGYVTMGAGARASVSTGSSAKLTPEGQGFQVTESVEGTTAGRRYRTYTGSDANGNAIVHLGIGEMDRLNLLTGYPIRVGLLGQELGRAGLRVACIGNADTPLARHREIVAMAITERGVVELGNVGAELVRKSPPMPSSLTTNEQRFLEVFAQASKAAEVVFAELGETARAGEYADRMTPAQAVAARHRAIERSDRLLGKALSLMPKERWAALVVTPMLRLPEPEEQFAALAPVILGGPEAHPGALTSASTRRSGLVVNTDVAATVLDYFGRPRPADTVGRPMTSVEVRGDKMQWLQAQVKRQDDGEAVRHYVIRAFPWFVAAAMWAAALLLLVGQGAPYWARTTVRALLAVALAAPVVAVMAGIYPMSAVVMAIVVCAGAVLLGLVNSWATLWRSAHVAPAVMLVLCLVYDLARGQNSLAWSPLSYSAASGARFYGLGNELGGGLLGAALVAAAGALGSRAGAGPGKRLGTAAILATLVALVAHPRLGANLGIALACALGFGVFMLYLWRDRPGWREVAAVGLLLFGLVGAAIMVDVFVKGGQASHVGMFVASVKAQGWPALWDAISRKMAMNLMLVRTSAWSDAAAGAGALLVVVWAGRPTGVLAAVREQEWLHPAMVACVIGALGAFLLNDSGVVAAGMALLYGMGALAYAALGGGRR